MKKMMMAIAAAVMMSSSMLAQESKPEGRPEMRRGDRTEMMKKRTDETVQRYGLNEEQAAKLLELNTRYADKMGPRGQHRFGQPGQRPDSVRPRPQRGEIKDRPERHGDRQGMRGNFEEMRKNMEAYDAELQQIMTEEQFKAYKADQEKRMKEGPRGRRPQQSGN